MKIPKISPLSIFSIITLLLGWWILCFYFPASLLAPPASVAHRFYDLCTTGFAKLTLFQHIGVSLIRVLLGFVVGAAIGVPLGLLMGWYKKVEEFVDPIFEILRPIPPIAWIPLAILWFGIGEGSKIFVIMIGGLVACLINSYAAMKTTPEILIKAAKSLGATDRNILIEVAIPHCIPFIFSAFRIALGAGWMTLVAAEMIASTSGLGFLILMGREWIMSDLIIAGMLTIGAVGYFMDYALKKIEGKICPWRKSD